MRRLVGFREGYQGKGIDDHLAAVGPDMVPDEIVMPILP
jgi:hypothetical protein